MSAPKSAEGAASGPTMEYRRVGKSGLKVSVLSFGSWVNIKSHTAEDLVFDLIKTAIEAGVNFIDTAEAYGAGEAETQLGRALRRGGWSREELVISTKIFWGPQKGVNNRGLSFKHIVEGLNASLARLQLDYVDMVFCHRPDPDTPIEETVRAMNHVINHGKAFYWGTSEWSAGQILEAHEVARRLNLIAPVVEQPQYNMFSRQRVESEYAPLYTKSTYGMGLTIWSPLAYGLLTGKYNEGIPAGSRLTQDFFKDSARKLTEEEGKRKIEKVKALQEIAKELGASVTQLALAWCAKNQNVSTVIVGASSVDQLKENLKAMEVLPKLNDEIMGKIESIIGGGRS